MLGWQKLMPAARQKNAKWRMMTDKRLFVTFDTNTYSRIADPQPRKLFQKWWPMTRDRWRSKKQRIAWMYLNRCIQKGRIVAGIPEALLATEALEKISRVQLLMAVGTNAPRPNIPQGRIDLIGKAIMIGFKVMGMPRIGHPPLYTPTDEEKAQDLRYNLGERIDRSHAFGRHFNDYAHNAVRDLGERLAKAHGLTSASADFATQFSGETPERYLWRQGLSAEEATPKAYKTAKEFQSTLRHLLADWTDFDVAAAHYGYGYDYLCTEDLGNQSSNSIFGPQHQTVTFGVTVVTALELMMLALNQFGIPIKTWPQPAVPPS